MKGSFNLIDRFSDFLRDLSQIKIDRTLVRSFVVCLNIRVCSCSSSYLNRRFLFLFVLFVDMTHQTTIIFSFLSPFLRLSLSSVLLSIYLFKLDLLINSVENFEWIKWSNGCVTNSLTKSLEYLSFSLNFLDEQVRQDLLI